MCVSRKKAIPPLKNAEDFVVIIISPAHEKINPISINVSSVLQLADRFVIRIIIKKGMIKALRINA
jgi:hypothetical protein